MSILVVLYWMIALSLGLFFAIVVFVEVGGGIPGALIGLVFGTITGTAWPFTIAILLIIMIVAGETQPDN